MGRGRWPVGRWSDAGDGSPANRADARSPDSQRPREGGEDAVPVRGRRLPKGRARSVLGAEDTGARSARDPPAERCSAAPQRGGLVRLRGEGRRPEPGRLAGPRRAAGSGEHGESGPRWPGEGQRTAAPGEAATGTSSTFAERRARYVISKCPVRY